MKPLVIYHSPCVDGWTAAWAIVKAHGGPEFVDLYPANYGDIDRPTVTGRDVIIVDFSYPRDILESMHAAADSLLVLDHHKSARDELAGFAYAEFDMNRSGAAMAWDYFHPEKSRPQLVNYVQDRDLWTWNLPHSKEVSAAIGLVEHTYEAWERLNDHMRTSMHDIMFEGTTILRYVSKLVNAAVDSAGLVTLTGDDTVVPCVVCEPTIRSEVGNLLLEDNDHPYSVTFRETEEGWGYSLCSKDDRVDVGALAAHLKARFGCVSAGGGHHNYAGFLSNIPMHQWVIMD